VWDAQTGQSVMDPLKGHDGWVTSVGFSPDGRHIVSGSGDKTVRVWDAQTGQSVMDPLKGHDDWVRSVAFSPDGRYIVSGSDDKTVRVWDAQTGQSVMDPLKGHDQYFTVPPPFLQESTGMGPESAGIHRNGTSKVQHSGYSPSGIW